MRRRRSWRPNLLDALLSAGIVGGALYLVLAHLARMNTNAAAMCGCLAAGFALRHALRIPSVRLTWRRR